LADQLRALIKGGNVKAIVLLGKEAYVDFFYKTEIEAGTFNINSFRVGPKIGWQDMRKRPVPSTFPKVYFTYHPSYILRNGGTACQDYPAWKNDFMAIKRWGADGLYIKPRGQEILA
jgi:uracil-DNA glycosylase